MVCNDCRHSHEIDISTAAYKEDAVWQLKWVECRYFPPEFVPWGTNLSYVYFRRTKKIWGCSKWEPKEEIE